MTAVQRTEGVRCSDADRERTSERLRTAAGEGYLTMDELDERLTRAYAARYGHELDALVLDLPRARRGGAVPAALWTRVMLLVGRHGSGWRRRRLVLAVVVGLAVLAVAGAAGLEGLDIVDGDDGADGADGGEGADEPDDD
jgi:hypothetical protein